MSGMRLAHRPPRLVARAAALAHARRRPRGCPSRRMRARVDVGRRLALSWRRRPARASFAQPRAITWRLRLHFHVHAGDARAVLVPRNLRRAPLAPHRLRRALDTAATAARRGVPDRGSAQVFRVPTRAASTRAPGAVLPDLMRAALRLHDDRLGAHLRMARRGNDAWRPRDGASFATRPSLVRAAAFAQTPRGALAQVVRVSHASARGRAMATASFSASRDARVARAGPGRLAARNAPRYPTSASRPIRALAALAAASRPAPHSIATRAGLSLSLRGASTRLVIRDDAATRRSTVDARPPRPAALVWRNARDADDSPGGAALPRMHAAPGDAVQSALRSSASGTRDALHPAPSAPDAPHALRLDATLVDRLADDVIRRVERRARIERERRGI